MTHKPAYKTEQHGRLQARKAPSQSRSRTTVEAIKQAAREMVATEGFSSSSTSTTLIAERAGVSIGSLYQYFPTREAIFLALFEETSAQMTTTMKKVMVRILDQPLEKGVPEVMRHLLALHREHELLLLKMVAQVPQLKLATQPLSFENMIFDAIRIAVSQWTPGLSLRDLDRRAFFLREIILGCIHRYLSDSPENLTDRAFLDDLAQIVMHYISLPAKKRS
jgi:AcrR family transcriptional regulator